MKVIILAGGLGTRISEYTQDIPKPMVPIGDTPIIHHIMKRYASFGHKDFYLALGYKAHIIKQYFSTYHLNQSDFSVNLSDGKIENYAGAKLDWKVNLVNTGLHTMTGGRLKRLKSHIGDKTFMLTYGDGLANVDLNALLQFHKSHGKMVTCTAVRPSARFGELLLNNNDVISFLEKPQTESGWINGGYFVINPEFIDLIESDNTVLEQKPLEMAASNGQLMAFKHTDFWQCMDTRRDKDLLEELNAAGDPPWTK
jgi:glucose-1-phosphate cytidylyltransferase